MLLNRVLRHQVQSAFIAVLAVNQSCTGASRLSVFVDVFSVNLVLGRLVHKRLQLFLVVLNRVLGLLVHQRFLLFWEINRSPMPI